MLGINIKGIPSRERSQVQKTVQCVSPVCKDHYRVKAGVCGRFRAMTMTEHFNVMETVHSITVRSAYNCICLSKTLSCAFKWYS